MRMWPPDLPRTARLQGAAQPPLELTSVNLLTWEIALSEATQATVGVLLRPCDQAYATTGKSQKTTGTVQGSISHEAMGSTPAPQARRGT